MELQCVQASIHAVARKKFGMRALLDDCSLIEDENPSSMHHG